MQINNLILKNFGCIKDSTFKFTKGINLILGDNGTGKSHILKALAFLLINYTQKAIENYCNWNSNSFILKMNLTHLQKNFDFKYKYNRTNNKLDRELYINEHYYKGQDVINILTEYFDPSLCKASIISFQGKIDLIDAKPAERRESLKKIRNLDFDKQVKELDNEIKEIEDGKLFEVNNEILILKNRDYTFSELEKLPFDKTVYLSLQEEFTVIQDKINSIQKDIEFYNKLILQKQHYERNIQDIKNDNLKLQEFVEQSEKDILTSEAILNSDLEENLRKLKEELNQDFEIYKRNLENEISSIKLIRVPSFNKDELSQARDKVTKQFNLWSSYDKQYELCLKGKCPTCGHIFDSDETDKYKKLAKDAEIKLTELKNHVLKLEKQELFFHERKDKAFALKSKKEKLQLQLDAEIKNIQNKKDKILQNIQQEKKDIELLKKENQTIIDMCEKSINKTIEDIRKNKEKILEIKSLIKELKIPLSVPEVSKEDTVKLNEIQVKIDSYNHIVEQNKLITKQNIKLKEQKEQDEKKLKEYRKERDELMKSIQDLKRGKLILQKEFPNFVISTMVGDIETGINDLVNRIYDGRYEVKIKENKGGIEVLYGQKKSSIETASGFEKGLFNFGYKHAFSQIAGLGILLLDEIDAFASEKNSEKLFTVIGQLNNLYKQVFIITHKPAIQEVLSRDYHATVFEMINGNVIKY